MAIARGLLDTIVNKILFSLSYSHSMFQTRQGCRPYHLCLHDLCAMYPTSLGLTFLFLKEDNSFLSRLLRGSTTCSLQSSWHMARIEAIGQRTDKRQRRTEEHHRRPNPLFSAAQIIYNSRSLTKKRLQ